MPCAGGHLGWFRINIKKCKEPKCMNITPGGELPVAENTNGSVCENLILILFINLSFIDQRQKIKK